MDNNIYQRNNSVSWSDTILDKHAWAKHLNPMDKNDQMRVVYYIFCIVLYCISFKYLFENKNTEYVVYVFVFIINCVFPFLWIGDFRNIVSLVNSPLLNYKSTCIAIGSIIVFVALFLVLLTNEYVRKQKESNRTNTDDTQIKNLDVKGDNVKEYKDKVILIVFISFIVILWSMVGETFSNSESIFSSFVRNDTLDKYKSNFVKLLGWLLDQPYYFAENLDKTVHSFFDKFNMHPLPKIFAVYSVTFIVVFFGAFVRIPQHPEKIKNRIDRFNIVNMTPVFTEQFERNYKQYRDFTMFSICFIISAVFGYLVHLPRNMIGINTSRVLTAVGSIITFSVFFAKGVHYDIEKTKKLVMAVLCIIFAVLGTPVVYGIFQMFMKFQGFNALIQIILAVLLFIPQIFINIFNKITNTDNFNLFGYVRDYINTSNIKTGNMYHIVMNVIIFLVLFVGIFVDSITETSVKDHTTKITNFLNNDNEEIKEIKSVKWFYNKKSLMMFAVILITMAISLFAAFTSYYNGFSILYTVLKTLMEIVVVYPAPIASVGISIVMLVFSLQNYRKFYKKRNTDN